MKPGDLLSDGSLVVATDGLYKATVIKDGVVRELDMSVGMQLPQPQKLRFDPDMSPHHQSNKAAAEEAGLRWSSKRKAYVDEDGCLIRDRFGQRL